MKKSILSILAVLLLVGGASALVYVGYNYMARATIDIPATGEEGIETYVCVGDCSTGGWTNSVGLTDVEAGDTINITFRHENKYANDISGTIVYEIVCMDDLSWASGMCEGQILDFYNTANAPDDDCGFMRAGLVFTDTDGTITEVNDPANVFKLSNSVAQVYTTVDDQTFPAGSITYTNLEMTFHDQAQGKYNIDGFVLLPE